MIRATLMTVAAIALIGCGETSQPGGPRANMKPPIVGVAENAFKISVPATETNIKQGETQLVSVSVNRGKNFADDVKLSFSEMPNGLSVSPTSATVKSSEKEIKLSVEASKSAAVGHHTITVWGTPSTAGGEKTSVDMKIEVKPAS